MGHSGTGYMCMGVSDLLLWTSETGQQMKTLTMVFLELQVFSFFIALFLYSSESVVNSSSIFDVLRHLVPSVVDIAMLSVKFTCVTYCVIGFIYVLLSDTERVLYLCCC